MGKRRVIMMVTPSVTRPPWINILGRWCPVQSYPPSITNGDDHLGTGPDVYVIVFSNGPIPVNKAPNNTEPGPTLNGNLGPVEQHR